MNIKYNLGNLTLDIGYNLWMNHHNIRLRKKQL